MHALLRRISLIAILSFISMTSQHAIAIINGLDAPEEKLPFFSQIYFKVSEKDHIGNDMKDEHGNVKMTWDNQCGGILLYHNYILTAKHCVVAIDGSLEDIRVSYIGEPGRLFDVGKIFTPPSNYLETVNYFPNAPSAKQINYKNGDLAILYIPGINPDTAHSLAAQNNNHGKYITPMGVGENGSVFGMGLTEQDGNNSRTSNVKMLDMSTVDSDECSEPNGNTLRGNPYIGYRVNRSIELCARSKLHDDKRRSAYHHDSGGPLLLQRDNNYLLAGIISHTLWKDMYHPERDNSPVLTLAQVNSFKNWIDSIVLDSWVAKSMIISMREIYGENELLVSNNDVYIYNSTLMNRKYKKIEYVKGALSSAWWGDFELSDNKAFAFTPKDKWIVDVNDNFLSIYDLSKKQWGNNYFHNYNELSQFIDSPAITDNGIHLFTKFGTIYSAKVLDNGNIYNLQRATVPPVDGLKKLYSFFDASGNRYAALNDAGQLLFSVPRGEWINVTFSGVSSSFVEDVAFGHGGTFLVKIDSEWYYNAGFVNNANDQHQKTLIRLKKLMVVDANENELQIHSVALSPDNKKLYAIGKIKHKTMLVVSNFSSL